MIFKTEHKNIPLQSPKVTLLYKIYNIFVAKYMVKFNNN